MPGGYKDFAVGEVLTSADVDEYLMRQSLMRVTSGTRPGSPAEGWHIYETDTQKILVYDGSSWVDILDLDGMESYSPSWTATSAPSIGNGTLTGRYQRIGKTIHGVIELTAGSTTNFGSGTWSFSLPVSPTQPGGAENVNFIGGVTAVDASASQRHLGLCLHFDTVLTAHTFASPTTFYNSTTPMTWATSDTLVARFTYDI